MENKWLKRAVIQALAVSLGIGPNLAGAGQLASTMVPGAQTQAQAAADLTGNVGAPTYKPLAKGGAGVQFSSKRIIVKFKGTAVQPPATWQPGGTVAKQQHPAAVAQQMASSLPQAAQSALSRIQGRAVKGYSNIGVMVVETPVGVGPAIEALYRSGTVEYAEPDFRLKALATTPNDPRFGDLWGMHNTGQYGGTPGADINATAAWDIRKDASTVIVGVVDTGIDYTHPDIKPNMWKNPLEIAGDGIDNDGNGYVDDVYGIDACNYDSDPMDDNSHGTHVSGTIGGRGNNGVGVTGMAWNAKLMGLKFLCSDGSGWTSDAVQAIDYAIKTKAANSYARMVLSNSWGGGGYSQSLYDIIAAARDAGILFVAAAGNDGMDTDTYVNYPSGYDLANIVVVGASDDNDQPAWFSNRGCSSVHLFAPGVNIWSTVPGNSYASYNGTSMATPHISGLAALIWAQYPTSTWQKIKNALLNGVDGKSSLARLAVTQGRANAATSLDSQMLNLPTVWRVTPAKAGAGDTVTIQGQFFGSTPGTVAFNGTPMTVVSWSGGTIKAQVPSGVTGEGSISVTTTSASSRPGGCMKVANMAQAVGNTILPHAWAASAQVGSDVWIIGGGTYWGQTGLVERYTVGTNRSVIDSAWTMPTTATNLGAAAIGSKIYAVGGMDWNNSSQALDTLQIFDTVSKTWTQGPKLPQPMLQPAVVGLGNGKLYVFGGSDASMNILNTTYIYDPSTNTWSSGAPMPVAKAWAGAVQIGTSNRAWIMGGFTCSSIGCESSEVYEYNADTNAWTAKPALTQNRAASGAAYFNAMPYMVHGSGNGYFALRSGEHFTSGKWIADIEGGANLYAPLTGKNSNYLFILGGSDGQQMSSTVWRVKK